MYTLRRKSPPLPPARWDSWVWLGAGLGRTSIGALAIVVASFVAFSPQGRPKRGKVDAATWNRCESYRKHLDDGYCGSVAALGACRGSLNRPPMASLRLNSGTTPPVEQCRAELQPTVLRPRCAHLCAPNFSPRPYKAAGRSGAGESVRAGRVVPRGIEGGDCGTGAHLPAGGGTLPLAEGERQGLGAPAGPRARAREDQEQVSHLEQLWWFFRQPFGRPWVGLLMLGRE